MKKQSVVYHDFYCLNCGEKTYTLPRRIAKQYQGFHRKKLYCPHCKVEVAHVEVRNPIEAQTFLQQYAEGAFKEEARESIETLAGTNIFDIFDSLKKGES